MAAAYLLVCNAGSSSLKIELFDDDVSVVRASIAGIRRERAELAVRGRDVEPLAPVADHSAAAALLFDGLASGAYGAKAQEGDVAATAHRVVHGGADFTRPLLIDEGVLRRLDTLDELAPLHNPAAVEVIHAARERFPRSAAAAVFDTSFFAELPAQARTYALPGEWRDKLRLRRYGFHGIAHEFMYRRYRELVPASGGNDRVVSFQLGQGCSAAALSNGRPVDTSMGYTPLEGLVMGTRPGDVDAGVLLALARAGYTADAVDAGLQHGSGLRGLAGSDDMRQVQAAAAAGDAAAALAIAVFCHRAVKYLGAYAAVLGGLDAVLFGGGIGENSAEVRAQICAGAAWLGLELDARANDACIGTEGRIAAPGSAVDAYAIPVREEAAIARAARALFLQGTSVT